MSDFMHLPPGGEVQLLHNLLAQESSSEIEFSLLGMSFSKEYSAGQWQELNVGDIRYRFFPLCQILKSKEKARIPFRLRMVWGIRKYYRTASLDSFDAIYVQAPETVLPLTGYGGKIALHVHTDPDQTLRISRFPLFRLPVFSSLYTARIAKGIRRADRIIWSADTIRRNYTSVRPDSASMVDAKSVVVHSCYDPSLLPGAAPVSFREDVTYFITVGRLARGKRVDFLLEVFFDHLKTHPSERTEMVICGDGEEMANLTSQARDLGISEYVHFTGDLERPALAACLQHARLFLFASASETMSLVVLESLFMGVPVITGDVGDLHLAVRDGETGYVIREHRKEDYLAAIDKVLALPKESWETNCRTKAKEFSPRRMNDEVCEQLKSLF